MEAVFPGEAAVVFLQKTTSVDEVLDVAQHAFAPFVSLSVSRLDPSELIESWVEDNEGDQDPPAALLRQWEGRAGQIDGVFVQWIASGAVCRYIAVPAWKQEMEELCENWTEEQDVQRTDLARAVFIRWTYLAEQVERNSEYRGGTTHSRGPIGKTILEPLLQSNEADSYTIKRILGEASRLVRDNAQAEYSKLIGQMDQLAADLRSSRQWQQIRWARDRTAAARELLVQRSGGYSPPVKMVDELRRLAEE